MARHRRPDSNRGLRHLPKHAPKGATRRRHDHCRETVRDGRRYRRLVTWWDDQDILIAWSQRQGEQAVSRPSRCESFFPEGQNLVSGALATLAGPVVGEAQQARRVYRIGILSAVSASTYESMIALLRQGLRDRPGTWLACAPFPAWPRHGGRLPRPRSMTPSASATPINSRSISASCPASTARARPSVGARSPRPITRAPAGC